MLSSALGVLVLAASAATASVQEPFAFTGKHYDDGLFSPLEDLGVLSTAEFTTLGHPLFPDYNVRIKKSDFCDGTVRAFTGYIDIQARHLFFYFFESRNDPDKDDVIFWTNGGPGCSSSIGLFMELGPCRVNDVNNVTFNPHSWNENANVFFIDQPVGVGFSYAEYGEYVSTSEEAAKDISAFVAIFFEHFSKFKSRPFHMAGESYGGRYIPTFASFIYDNNARLIQAGATPINLTSIMIGNGCTNTLSMIPAYYEMQCQPKSVAPVSTIGDCIAMKQTLPRCQKWLKEACYDMTDSISCSAATSFCASNIEATYFRTGLNPYDISKPCDGPISETLCYPITKKIASFLDRPDIRQTIGVDASLRGNFSGCSNAVGRQFHSHLDGIFPADYYIAALLERGIRTLIYVGAYDWICNWVGNEQMTLQLEWTGKEAFNAEPLRDWSIDDSGTGNGAAAGSRVAGKVRSSGALTFVTIAEAGHMAPYDKPKESLEMAKRWLAGKEF